jgi:hypothetical protein
LVLLDVVVLDAVAEHVVVAGWVAAVGRVVAAVEADWDGTGSWLAEVMRSAWRHCCCWYTRAEELVCSHQHLPQAEVAPFRVGIVTMKVCMLAEAEAAAS